MDTPSDIDCSSSAAHTPAEDWRALGDLIELAAERLSTPVEGTHQAFVDRWFGFAGAVGSRGHRGHRTITRGIYSSVRLAGSLANAVMSTGVTAIERHRPIRPLWDSPLGAEIQAAANALWGDEFERRDSPMHTELGIRDSHGDPVAPDAASLEAAFAAPTGKVAVLLHGLGKTEQCWGDRVNDSGVVPGMAGALERGGFTVILVRYNTGKQVADNAAALAELLEEITKNWPTHIEEIDLIGHSMGGLVARSSLYAAEAADHEWTDTLGHLVGIGTPHFGSPIEKGVHGASVVLDRAAVSQPLSRFLEGRSAGIKDMRHGTLHHDHSDERYTDTWESDNIVIPPIPGVHQHHAAGVVTPKASHPIGFLIGDLVVRVNSATGKALNRRVEATNARVFVGLNHLGMLHDPTVHSQVKEWITPPRHMNSGSAY
jgi:pimeloyl-ACP methyl ester carboxylesterase